MFIASILVCLGPGEHNEGVLDVAVDLAKSLDSHLVGLDVLPTDGRRFAAAAVAFKSRHMRDAFVTEAELEARFLARADREGLSRQWLSIDSEAMETILRESVGHELLVIGQASPVMEDHSRVSSIIEQLVLKSGRPVLIVPYSAPHGRVGRRILVGWNGSRESARAVEDAMPLLERADTAIVLTVDPKPEGTCSTEQVVALLKRHGVRLQLANAKSRGASVGNALVEEVITLNCDLMVMGAYGHSPIREHMLGGPTYDVIQHTTVPVLMSH